MVILLSLQNILQLYFMNRAHVTFIFIIRVLFGQKLKKNAPKQPKATSGLRITRRIKHT
jgi:hypothetical protein